MRGQIVYIKNHANSERQAQESYNSFKKNGWDVELIEGITRHTCFLYTSDAADE